MELPIVTAFEHHQQCIDEGNDPFEDNAEMQSYMARWDGPPFFELLGDLSGRTQASILRRSLDISFRWMDLYLKEYRRL
jgi:hypothetical protein